MHSPPFTFSERASWNSVCSSTIMRVAFHPQVWQQTLSQTLTNVLSEVTSVPLRTTGLEWQPRRTEHFFEGKTMIYLTSVLQDPFSVRIGLKRLHHRSSIGKQKARSQILQWFVPSILFFKMFLYAVSLKPRFYYIKFLSLPPWKSCNPLARNSFFVHAFNKYFLSTCCLPAQFLVMRIELSTKQRQASPQRAFCLVERKGDLAQDKECTVSVAVLEKPRCQMKRGGEVWAVPGSRIRESLSGELTLEQRPGWTDKASPVCVCGNTFHLSEQQLQRSWVL